MPGEPASSSARHRTLLVVTFGILAGAFLTYGRTFVVPYVGDDPAAIPENPTIRNIFAIGSVLTPPVGEGNTVGGRPLLNLSLAINYAISGTNVWSYHLGNLLIHTAAGLLLFGLVRRTLRNVPHLVALAAANHGSSRPLDELDVLSGLAAMLWVIHPLQTESVTYLIQRAESLVGLFYLLTLYSFVRAAAEPATRAWRLVSVAACFCGMATKEVMVSAPLAVLLYDVIFVSGNWREALRARPAFYGALASSWLLLAGLVVSSAGRGGSAGFGTGASVWRYSLTQAQAIVHYLRLAAWPKPLIFDYGTETVASLVAVLPQVFALAIGGFAVARAVRRRTTWGFLGAAFVMILAPTSSFVPVATQTIAEHRMYLPLAIVVVAAATGCYLAVGRRIAVVALTLVPAFGLLTIDRNETYRDELTLSADTAAHRPGSARAHLKLGNVLLARGRPAEASNEYRKSVELNPNYIEAYHDLGLALAKSGRPADALPAFKRALQMHPLPETYASYARALAAVGQTDEAIARFGDALKLQPDYIEALNDRGNLLLQQGRPEAALDDYNAAVRIAPNYLEAHLNRAVALLQLHRKAEALAACEAALRIDPDSPVAHWKAGDVLLESDRPAEAIPHYVKAIERDGQLLYALHNLGQALVRIGRPADALPFYERAIALNAQWPLAHHNLAIALAAVGRTADAVGQEQSALRLDPAFQEARTFLSQLQARSAGPALPTLPSR